MCPQHSCAHSPRQKTATLTLVLPTSAPPTRASVTRFGSRFPGFFLLFLVSNGLCYRGARDLEGSALHHAHAGNLTNVHNSGLLNATRSATPGFYHSYPTSPSSPRTLQTASTVNSSLSNNLAIEK